MANQWREIEAEWKGGNTFIGRNPSGGTVQMGKLDELQGVSPMELILAGLAGCTGIDIVDILQKKHEPLKALKVIVRGRRAEDIPKIYKEIEITYLLWGDTIQAKSVEQAIRLSEEKYCSVSLMLKPVAEIRSSYRIFSGAEIEQSKNKCNL